MAKCESAETDGIRRIESFPEWIEATAKLRELAERYNAAAGNLHRLEDCQHDQVRLDSQQSLASEVDDLRRAVVLQKSLLDEIEGECASEIGKQAEPSYQAVMARIQGSARDLSEALDEESSFRRMLERQRVATGTLPGVPSRLRREVRSLRRLPMPLPGCLTVFLGPQRGGGGQISSPGEN